MSTGSPSLSDLRRNYLGFFWHAGLLAVTVTFTDINTVLPSLIFAVGGNDIHLGILTGIMVGVPLAAQLLFAGFLHGRPRKKPWLLTGIYLRVLALALLTLIILFGGKSALSALLFMLYSSLLLFTLSGAFAGISYVDLVGKSFASENRRRFVVFRQGIMSVGTLASALITRMILSLIGRENAYPLLFGLSAGALLLASLGFWIISERPVLAAAPDTGNGSEAAGSGGEDRPAYGPGGIIRRIPGILKADGNLRRYIIAANLLGAGTVFLPFYVALGTRTYSLDAGMVGNLVLLQISGMVASNLIWHRVIRRFGFKGMLRVWSLAGALLPPAALAVSRFLPFEAYLPVFVFSGMYLGAQKISSDAVLLEISTDANRALYAGIFGTFNISLALLPVAMGGIISLTGYAPVGIFVAASAAAAQPIISRMVCPVDIRHPSPMTDDIVGT
jgi:hypothetical protein